MPRIERVFLMNHVHVDLGFTDQVAALWHLFDDAIVRAMDLIEATSDYPEPARFRHTCEVTCVVEHFLEHASPTQVDRFLNHARAGRIDIGAMWAHLTPIVDRRQMDWMMGRMQRLRDDYGLRIESAMQNDINGLAWPWVDVLLDAGVTGLTMGINHHRGGSPLRPRGYRWRGPVGRELLTWCGEHYNWGRWYGVPQDFDKATAEFDLYVERLESRGYDRPFAYLQVTGEMNWGDNNWPSEHLSDFVRRWNHEGRSPTFEIVTLTGFLDHLRAQGTESLPVMKGNWSDWWAFSVGAFPRQTALLRHTQERIDACNRLIDRVGDAERTATWQRDLDEAMRLSILFAEHTFGADEAADRPDSTFTEGSICRKAVYIHDAAALVERVYQQIGGVLRRDEGAGLNDAVVINPNDRPLARRLRLTASYTRPTVQNPPPMFAHDPARAEEDGFETDLIELGPGETRSVDRQRAQPIEWKDDDGLRLDGRAGQLTCCPRTGAIVRWLDASGRPVIGLDEQGLNAFVYEWVDSPEGRQATWHWLAEGWNDGFGHPGSREVLKGRPVSKMLRGQRGDSQGDPRLRLHLDAPGTESLSVTYRLHDDGAGIDILNRFELPADTVPRSIYFCFAPTLGPSAFWYDAAGTPARCRDQWPGSCHDTVCGGRWAAAVGGEASFLLWTPDAPLVQPGGISYLRHREEPPGENDPSHLASWAVNNHWEVNHPVRQAGPVVLRYTIRILPGGTDGDALQAAADDLGAQLLWLPFGRYDVPPLPS